MTNQEVDSDEEEEQVEASNVPEVAEPEVDATLTNSDVVSKYQDAAKIAQSVLMEIIKMCVVGTKIVDICRFGDDLIEKKTANIYKNKSKSGKIVLKGVAFPVCLSVNDCVCHCSPLESDDTEPSTHSDVEVLRPAILMVYYNIMQLAYPSLALDDMVKIDLGVHVDGFIAVVAHTTVVTSTAPLTALAPVAGLSPEKVNILNAAYVAAEVAMKLLKPGNTNLMITKAIKQVAEVYNVRPIAGTLSHQMKQYVVDGNKMIQLRDALEGEQKVESCTFEAGEVYAIDIAFSSGEGKPRETGNRTTIFKRAVERKYSLKVKSSRSFFNEINKRFPTLPFSLRCLPDEKAAKMGLRECVTHNLLLPYPVLNEKKGDLIAHVKYTVLILPSGNTVNITGLPPIHYELSGANVIESPSASSLATSVGMQLYEQLQSLKMGGVNVETTSSTAPPSTENNKASTMLSEDIVNLLKQSKPDPKKKAKKSNKKKESKPEVEESG